jgi:hypothetical protein
MKNLLQMIQDIKNKTQADVIVIGIDETEEFRLIIQKGEFEQYNVMILDTQNTADSIANSFLQSYDDQQKL